MWKSYISLHRISWDVNLVKITKLAKLVFHLFHFFFRSEYFKLNSISIQFYILLLTLMLNQYSEGWFVCCTGLEAKREHLFQLNYFFFLLYATHRSATNCLCNEFLIDFQRILTQYANVQACFTLLSLITTFALRKNYLSISIKRKIY